MVTVKLADGQSRQVMNSDWMIRSIRGLATIIMASLLLAGCAESTRPMATGNGNVRGINAIVTSPELIFLNEEQPIGNVNYRDVAGFKEWDDLTYNFNFDILLPDTEQAERLATQFIDVQADFEYTVVLTGTLANPSILFWEAEEKEWTGTETVFEVDFVHLSPLLGQVDIYYAPTGTTPVSGNQIGTLSNGDHIPYMELEQGEYEIILTAPGDPSTIVFQSGGIERTPANRITIALFDTNPTITATVGVNIIFDDGASLGIFDVNSLPQLRLGHASYGGGNIDGYFDNDFETVVFEDIGFLELSPFVDMSGINLPLDVTPTGDPGTILVEAEVQRVNNTRRSLIFWGLPGTHSIRLLEHEARPIEVFPFVRITNLSSSVGEIDIYVTDPETVLDETVFPDFGNAISGVTTGFFAMPIGMQDIVLTLPGEQTTIGPIYSVDLTAGEVLDLIIVDTADPAAAEIRILDSIP